MKVRRKWTTGMMILVLLLGTLSVPKGAEAASGKVKVKKVTSVSSITDSKTIYLAKGKTVKLKTTVTVTPDKPANQKVTYKSSNKKVATVTGKGVIKGKKTGNAKITVTSKKDSKKKATVKVKVVKGKVTGIKLNETSQILTVGDTVKLKADVKTSKGGRKDVVWTSSKEKVATVKKGTVTAVGAGETTITVKAADGSGKKATCKVRVMEPEATEKNASDVAALQTIIKEQKSFGADVPTNLDASAYTWNGINGRLTGIDWSGCKLQGTLSFEGLTALTLLSCSSNQLTGLDVSKNTSLTFLSCSSNQLTGLDVSKNAALGALYCHSNKLTKLDVSKNTELTDLDCHDNKLTKLDVSKNTALTDLDCRRNKLIELDMSKNTALSTLYCYGNQLTKLDVSKNTALTDLECQGNQLTKLDVGKNTVLTILSCDSNQLTKLDVGKNTVLTILSCDSNQLSKLDVSKNTALTILYCHDNQLTELDVSKNTALTTLDCSGNQLTSLDVTNCTRLTSLYYDKDKVTIKGYLY